MEMGGSDFQNVKTRRSPFPQWMQIAYESLSDTQQLLDTPNKC